ncbi:MAG: hypothetical protein RIT26_2137 [Pseudomonadota bacterium]|jgi:hypothetical protein
MSRSVQRLGPIEVIGDLDWPSFLTESARAYAKKHSATHWIQIGENQGFYSPENMETGEKPFAGALYSVAALVYGLFSHLTEKSERNIRELDVLVLLPSQIPDEVCWVRLDDGVITQDLIMTGIDALDRLRHLPSYVTVYSALDAELPHANIKPINWRMLVRHLPREARIRAAKFQIKNLSRRAKILLAAGVLATVALIGGGIALYQALKPPKVVEAPVDHTDTYWDTLKTIQSKTGDKIFAQKIWNELTKLPLVEDGWSRVRVICRVDQCNHDWNLMAGTIESLEAKYKVSSYAGSSARTEVPNTFKPSHAPFELIESQQADKLLGLVRDGLGKSDQTLVLEITNPTQVTLPGLIHVRRFASQRTFTIKAKASSFAEILQTLPDNAVIDQIDLTIEADPKLVIEGKVYVL